MSQERQNRFTAPVKRESHPIYSPRHEKKDFVTADVDLKQLQEYFNSIIQVVNQHAMLLDNVGKEL